MPTLRALRALRYAPGRTPELASVLCPPYDIISPEQQERLMALDPHNAVHLELPRAPAGADPAARYGLAARTLASWRDEGVLVVDDAPTLTVHEMRWHDAAGSLRTARGFFARVRLEPLDGGGVRRHERTMSGPREDRYRLLEATITNLSPVVMLHEADADATRERLERLTGRPTDATATTSDGVEHRLWVCPATGAGRSADGACDDADALLALVAAVPLTIADGHHRYETALRYREACARGRQAERDPAWDYLLALLYHVDESPPVLPSHRVLRQGPSGEALLSAVGDLVTVRRLDGPEGVVEAMADRPSAVTEDATGTGRFGLVSGEVSAILTLREDRVATLLDPGISAASRGLDVNRLAVVLERLGVDGATLAAGERLEYLKDAREAVARVAGGSAAAAFLLDGAPVTAVTRVAAAGEVMPQKSTYFDPKAPTGLVFGPLEW